MARCLSAARERARWVELGRVANTDHIETHLRLLRSLSFGDDGYDDCIHEVAPRAG